MIWMRNLRPIRREGKHSRLVSKLCACLSGECLTPTSTSIGHHRRDAHLPPSSHLSLNAILYNCRPSMPQQGRRVNVLPLSTSTNPSVSVVIAACNHRDFLNQAIDSVLAQTFDDYELIVVDDASDETAIRQYHVPEGCMLIRHNERRRAAAARNTGIAAARGKYIAIMDHDDVWLPDKLESQVSLLEENPSAGLAFCHYTAVDMELIPLPRQRGHRKIGANPLRQLVRRNLIRSPSLTLARREAIDNCGAFDESVIGASDWDFYLRLAARYPFIADPARRALYRTHPGQMSRNRLAMRRASVIVMEKTLGLARAERPDVVIAVRRRLCSELRGLSRALIRSGEDGEEAWNALHRAIAIWPWSLRPYGQVPVALRYARRWSSSAANRNGIGENL
jgi:glycosyltransferase involved in cell wall biosynthesis